MLKDLFLPFQSEGCSLFRTANFAIVTQRRVVGRSGQVRQGAPEMTGAGYLTIVKVDIEEQRSITQSSTTENCDEVVVESIYNLNLNKGLR